MTTEEQLEAITDAGQFEKLATAVLRAADARYIKLIHVGVNAQAKPIPSPIDGVVIIGSGANVVASAYTTIGLPNLRSKWLDPKEGDVAKGLQALKEALGTNDEKRNPILVLVTNRAPPQDLMQAVGAECAAANVELDLWERSRLAGFLDGTADGHWLRQTYLSIKAERLSRELLMKLARDSRVQYAKTIPASAKLTWRRDEARLTNRTAIRGLTVLSGDSGYGKSALALRLMNAALDLGRPVLWVDDRILDEETLLSRAVHRTLEELHGSNLNDVSFSLATQPGLFVVIDDVAKTHQPSAALQKILSWARNTGGTDITSHSTATAVHLLAPIWPDFVVGLREDLAKDLDPFTFELHPLELDEAIEVYRVRTDDRTSTDDEIARLVGRLGNDPLLIDLCDRTDPDMAGATIVRSWIIRQLRKVSQKTGRPTQFYEDVLRDVAIGMLRARAMTPSVSEVEVFLSRDNSKTAAVAWLVRESEILRWAEGPSGETLSFRHDRVRDAILADAISRLIDVASSDPVLGDPYYAELVGEAIVTRHCDNVSLEVAAKVCPLALFSALWISGRASVPSNSALIERIHQLLSDGQCEDLPTSFRWAVAALLAGTDAPEVEGISKLTWVRGGPIDEALVRNGKVDVAANFILNHDLALTYPERDRLIVHAARRHANFLPTIAGNLIRNDLDSVSKRALLLLAGFTRSAQLATAIQQCIANQPLQTPEEVEAALWAATQCCQDNLDSVLDVVLDAFAKLSDQRSDSMHLAERERALLDLGGRRIAANLPVTAVPSLLRQWAKRPEIQRELQSFFYRVDDPRMITQVIRTRADSIREDAAAGKKSWGYSFFGDEWRSDLRYGRRMSAETRNALGDIWQDGREKDEDRKLAFTLWRAQLSLGDLPILRQANEDALLADDVLQSRVSLGDRDSFAEFIRRSRSTDSSRTYYWWFFARGQMDEQLAIGLDSSMARQDLDMGGDPGYIFSQLLMELEPSIAEKILVRHWTRIRDLPRFFQAALFINTQATRDMATDVFARSPDRKKLFEHLAAGFGLNEAGRSERVTLAHLDVLVPYLDCLSEQELKFFWHGCNHRGWFGWRRLNLDDRVAAGADPPHVDVESRERLLDQCSANRGMIWSGMIERDFCGIGYSVDEAFSIIAKWAAKRATQAALLVAVDLFANMAYRRHLPIIEELLNDTPEHQRMRGSVNFAVKYRTLI
jgi:hypothetical protein